MKRHGKNEDVSVDFDSVKRVIREEGLDTRFIRILYENLTPDEVEKLVAVPGARKLSEGRVLAPYPEKGDPLFPKKATQIHTLQA